MYLEKKNRTNTQTNKTKKKKNHMEIIKNEIDYVYMFCVVSFMVYS